VFARFKQSLGRVQSGGVEEHDVLLFGRWVKARHARILSSRQLSVQTGSARLHFYGLPTTGLYSYAQLKGHRDTVQPRSISVRYDINDVEPMSGKEPLHQWNRAKSHNLGTTIGPNDFKSIMKKITPDTLPVEVTANHTPRECSHLFGIHGPTATRND
jgi:hypothetical protein